jgi:hypothetical protein
MHHSFPRLLTSMVKRDRDDHDSEHAWTSLGIIRAPGIATFTTHFLPHVGRSYTREVEKPPGTILAGHAEHILASAPRPGDLT